jgi:DNA-binding transcriptional LysR family regulator
MHTRWVTVASPAYLAKHGTPTRIRELAGHNCIKFRSPRGTAVEWSFADSRADDKVKTSGNLDLDQGELLLEAAASGLGICQALHFMVASYVHAGTLVEILRDYATPGPTIHALCLPGQRSSPRVRAFIDFLVDELANHDPAGDTPAKTAKPTKTTRPAKAAAPAKAATPGKAATPAKAAKSAKAVKAATRSKGRKPA